MYCVATLRQGVRNHWIQGPASTGFRVRLRLERGSDFTGIGKSGAYRGFFNFVRSRLLLERENYEAALFLLDDPDGIRGCGKPVILTIGHKEKLPAEMLRIAEKRNTLVFKELRMALEERNKSKAAGVWQQAMATCYTCHQGDNDVPRYRKFIPGEGEHAYHQLLVKQSGFACELCHKGNTSRIGYE